MARGLNRTVASNTGLLLEAPNGTENASVALLNPNDGIVYVTLNGAANLLSWDWKLPSQSYGHFPGPWQTLGIFYVDQSGSARAGEITLYASDDKLTIPEIHSIGRALQTVGAAVDITEGTIPANPGAGSARLWVDANHVLHLLDSNGVDELDINSRTALGGALTGFLPNPQIAANAVGTTQIAALSVTGAKLANQTVTAAQIANNTVGNSQLVGGTAALNVGALGGVLSGTLPNPGHSSQNDFPGLRAVGPNTYPGEGIEMPYSAGFGGSIQSYDRSGGNWRDLAINAKNLNISPQGGGSITLYGPISYPAGYTTKVLYDASAGDLWSNVALGAGNNGLPGYPPTVSVDANCVWILVILNVAAMISPAPTYAWMGWDIAVNNILYLRGSRQRVNSGNTESVSYSGAWLITPPNSGGLQIGPWVFTDATISGGMYLRGASAPATEFLRMSIIEFRC